MNVSYEISTQELSAELLPAREALGALNYSDIVANNTAAAVNFGGGETSATADQDIGVEQKG